MVGEDGAKCRSGEKKRRKSKCMAEERKGNLERKGEEMKGGEWQKKERGTEAKKKGNDVRQMRED